MTAALTQLHTLFLFLFFPQAFVYLWNLIIAILFIYLFLFGVRDFNIRRQRADNIDDVIAYNTISNCVALLLLASAAFKYFVMYFLYRTICWNKYRCQMITIS